MDLNQKKDYMGDSLLKNNKSGHKCNISNRTSIDLSGVKEVKSFDMSEIICDTILGGLLIKGSELHIGQLNLDKGNVEITGKIDAIIYSNKNITDKTTKSVLQRLFR